MAKFYKLRVKEVRKETDDCVSIAFDIPSEARADYHYKAGQYLTIKMLINGEDVRRSYSICSSPALEEDLRVAVKKVAFGKGSGFLNDQVKEGDYLEVMTPMGNFHSPMSPANKKNYVLFAGGSGITPMLSIIKTVLKQEPQSTLQLFYGNQNESGIIFHKELEEIENANASRLKIYHILAGGAVSDPVFSGIMDTAKNRQLLEKFLDRSKDNEFFICGPGGMMDSVMAALTEAGFKKDRIHIEYFSAPVDEKVIDNLNQQDRPGYVKSTVTVICDGDETSFTVEPGENILEKAIAANVDAPFACKGGSCCTCRALLVEGKVEMAVNFALLDDEVEQGFILTCQSHPLTPKVIVDYDRGR